MGRCQRSLWPSISKVITTSNIVCDIGCYNGGCTYPVQKCSFSSLSCSTVFFFVAVRKSSSNYMKIVPDILVHTILAANIEEVTADIVYDIVLISYPISYPISCHFYITKIRFKRDLESYFAIQNTSSLFIWATVVWWQNRPLPNLSHHGIQMWVIIWLSQPTNAHLTIRQKCW